MPESFIIFDFGVNEDAAQQARHRLEAWRQAFRLGDRLQFKFERTSPEPPVEAGAPAEKPSAKKKASAKSKSSKKKTQAAEAEKDAAESSKPDAPDRLRLVVRLDFPGHEKLSFQRWYDRLPAEAPFQAAEKRIVRPNEEEFETTSELFDKLD